MVYRDFSAIERRLIRILDALSSELSVVERKAITDLIDVDEYGLALEWLCGTLIEGRKALPSNVYHDIVALADSMDMRSTTITDALFHRVIPQ
jgi:hypothetical protein